MCLYWWPAAPQENTVCAYNYCLFVIPLFSCLFSNKVLQRGDGDYLCFAIQAVFWIDRISLELPPLFLHDFLTRHSLKLRSWLKSREDFSYYPWQRNSPLWLWFELQLFRVQGSQVNLLCSLANVSE